MIDNLDQIALGGKWAIEPNYGHQKLIEAFSFNKTVGMFADASRNDSYKLVGNGIALISFKGAMFCEDQLCAYGISGTVESIFKAYDDNNVRGIILEIHSGGGQVHAAAMLLDALQSKNKPVVTRVNFAASGGVLGTLPSDEIILTTPFSEMGSVGVMMTLDKSRVRMLKENYIFLYSEKSKRKNEGMREVIESDTFEVIKKELLEIDELFMSQVMKFRNIPSEAKDEVLSGAMFIGRDIIKKGLADGMGDMNYALRRIESLIKNR